MKNGWQWVTNTVKEIIMIECIYQALAVLYVIEVGWGS